jgi:hypothetical protein
LIDEVSYKEATVKNNVLMKFGILMKTFLTLEEINKEHKLKLFIPETIICSYD